MIKEGEQVKYFEAVDTKGTVMNPMSFRGEYLLISFLRGEKCPFCQLRLLDLLNNEKRLIEAGIDVYLLFHANNEDLVKSMEGLEPPKTTSIIADPDLAIHNMYETKVSYLGMMKTFARIGKIIDTILHKVFSLADLGSPPVIPADFVINRKGEIVVVHYGKDFTDNLSVDHVISKIEQNQPVMIKTVA